MQYDQKPIVGAIILAGAMIAGAILMRGAEAPAGNAPISKQIGLNTRTFNSCMESAKFKDKVQASLDEGIKAGVEGTPASFILKNGQLVSFITEDGKEYDSIPGAQPYEIVKANIARILESDVPLKKAPITPVSIDDHIVGDLNNAKLVIVEYSDLECPFCQRFHGVMKQIVAESDGSIAWVYRHFPLVQIHQNAFNAAMASECAVAQKGNDAFWKYADRAFEVGVANNPL
ncbi:MAG: thioredoxin domain-containing protein [Candidatus Paceibacterota bacterium]|jgi:protein-disulfide isomerase